MKLTKLNQVLLLFKDKNKFTPQEVSKKTGIPLSYTSAYLKRYISKGYIEKKKRGIYRVTDIGKEIVSNYAANVNDNFLSDESKRVIATNDNKDISLIDLENIDYILALKERYGREKLLAIIEKIKKLIE